ncbi:MAG: hypothetical protein ABWJ97_06235 [Thermoproteus sp.]
MSFYDFLWESVKRPELLLEYARRAGLVVDVDTNGDFYDRLKLVAKLSVEIFEAETSRLDAEMPQIRERCRDVRRFVLEARQDLEEAGRDASDLRAPIC